VNGKFPLFLRESEPLDDLVPIDVLILNNCLQLINGIAYTLNKSRHLGGILELVLDDVSDKSLELVLWVVDFVVTVDSN
jgi:hypothetical protein